MKVGEESQNWYNGKGMVADTSFIHSTHNESEDKDRFVLIVRFWHPELTKQEINAIRFLFDAFEDPTTPGLALACAKATARAKDMGIASGGAKSERGGGRRSKKKKKAPPGGGLGLLAKGMK